MAQKVDDVQTALEETREATKQTGRKIDDVHVKIQRIETALTTSKGTVPPFHNILSYSCTTVK